MERKYKMKDKKSPMNTVKEVHESKQKLVDKITSSLKPSEGESKDALKKRLLKTSNRKLLRLFDRTQK
jgi:hypothetical protein